MTLQTPKSTLPTTQDPAPQDPVLLTRLVSVGEKEFEFYISATFPITPYTTFLIDSLPDLEGSTVMDFGTGCGIFAVLAAMRGAHRVTACDVSSAALDLLARNASLHHVEDIIVPFLNVGNATKLLLREQFDVILCNPASLPSADPGSGFWFGGRRGVDMILKLIDVASATLTPNGRLLFIHTSLAALHLSLSSLARRHLAAHVVRMRRIPFRAHYAELTPLFFELRANGDIFFEENADGGKYETLYLIEARRFTTTKELNW